MLWIVPSPMCVMGYINDGRATSAIDEEVDRAAAAAAADCVERSGCGDGDCSGGERRGAHGAGRKANVAIVVDHDDKGGTLLPTPMDFGSPAKVVVEAVRRIEVSEKLLTDYGSEYMFSGPEWRRSGRGRGGHERVLGICGSKLENAAFQDFQNSDSLKSTQILTTLVVWVKDDRAT